MQPINLINQNQLMNNNMNEPERFEFNNINPLNSINQMNNLISQLNFEEELNVIFEDKNKGQKYIIHCQINDLISTIINKYKIKKGNNDNNNHKYIYNGKELKMNLTAGQSGLCNGSIITDILLNS